MPMRIPEELFHHELSYMYAFEQQNVETLERLAREVTHEAGRRPLEHHLAETREQVTLLERCFEALGQKPKNVTVHAARGLQQDHEAVVKLEPEPELLTLHSVAAAAKIEHLEVAAYLGLVEKATLLKQRPVAQLLRQILKQEQDAVRELEAAAAALGKELVPQMLALRDAAPAR